MAIRLMVVSWTVVPVNAQGSNGESAGDLIGTAWVTIAMGIVVVILVMCMCSGNGRIRAIRLRQIAAQQQGLLPPHTLPATDHLEDPTTAVDHYEDPTAVDHLEDPTTAVDHYEDPTAVDQSEDPTVVDHLQNSNALDHPEHPTNLDLGTSMAGNAASDTERMEHPLRLFLRAHGVSVMEMIGRHDC